MKVYRAGRIRTVKPGCEAGYFDRHPEAIEVKGKVPTLATLNRWSNAPSCKAIDGCTGIELDGHCSHGAPSWLRALNFI